MKWLLFCCLSSALPLPSLGQHIAKKQRASIDVGNCLVDSVKQTLIRLRPYANAILTFQYYYDNGGVRFVTVVWQATGKTYVKTFRDCGPAYIQQTFVLPPDTLFSFYYQQHIADLPEIISPDNAPSHDMAYLINVYLPGNTRFYNIRDYQRHLLRFAKQPLLPDEAPSPATEDPRSIWLDLFERIVAKDATK
ncbi:MAG: hypothetical protein ACRYFZ_12260 [Janthinobacterium lividum]